MRIILLFLMSSLLLACSKPADKPEGRLGVYHSSLNKPQSYLKCNIFSDETFHGHVSTDVENKQAQTCVVVNILKFPTNIFDEDSLFIQAYPFTYTDGDEIEYGESLRIKGFYKYGESKKNFFESNLIDKKFIQEMQSTPKDFFSDHYLKFCGLDPKYPAMQLVIYHKGEKQQAIPIRVTKFLLPPFSTNPEDFEKEQGENLLPFSPFTQD